MSNLDDFLRIELKGSPLEGSTPLSVAVRPTASGLQWLTAPSAVAGLAYRCTSSSLDRMQVEEDCVAVVCSCPLDSTAVQTAASPDGRLVAVACIDGSLRCWDSTASTMTLRWTLANAHSHVVPDTSASPSSDRSNAAAASGPIRSLAFSASDYDLLLVDNTTLRLYNAAASKPTVIASVENVTSAAWSSTPTQDSGSRLAVGKTDGSIEIFNFSNTLESISQLGSPSDEDGFTCTHLDWTGDTLVAGLCRVTPSDEEPDEDDDDDTAEHEAALFVTSIDSASYAAGDWAELGDVVPFFTVPKSGRHVYFTSVLKSAQNLVIVAANVGSDVGAAALDGSRWRLVEFQEGAAATTPTDEDDEFYFPVGLEVVQLPSNAFRLLLAATDGSISLFSFENENDPSCFVAPTGKRSSALPESTVKIVESASSSPPDLVAETPIPETQPSAPAPVETSAPASAFSFGSSASSGFSFGAPLPSPSPFGVGASTSFGSGAAPAFGSGSTSGLIFGKGTETSFSFGSSGSSGFGVTSPLGAAASTPAPKPADSASSSAPTFGASTFGSSATAPATGFGALAASNEGTGIFASNQFNAFEKPATSPMGGIPVKPLFGNTPTKVEKTAGEVVRPTTPTSQLASQIPKPGASPSGQESKSSTQSSLFGSEIPTTGTSSSPFGAFGSPAKSTPGVASMAKPLFGTPATPAPTTPKEHNSSASTEAPPPSIVEVAATSLTAAGKKAARIFDDLDKNKTGSLPTDKFEDLLDELGEGFYGDERDVQIQLLDPSGSGAMSRATFIDWYTALAEGGDDEDSDSLDSDEKAERADEEKKARKCFGDLSMTEAGVRVINVSDMEQLITNLGSTYGEDEFGKVVKKLKKPGDKIHETDFIAWYMDWLFGDDDGSDFEDSEDYDEARAKDTRGDADAPKQDLGSLFQVDKDSWKCEVCSVRNTGEKKQCPACETIRPGFEDDPEVKTGAASGASGSGAIGSGGFSFGGVPSGSIGGGGFSFGGGSTSSAKPHEKATSGFTFGGGASSGGGFSFGGAPAPTSDGKEKPGGGFTFAATSTTSGAPGFTFGASTSVPEKEKTPSSTPSEPSKDTSAKAVVADKLTAAGKKAARIFDDLDKDKAGSLPTDKFEDLLDELGEGFYGEERDVQIQLLDPSGSGTMSRVTFIDWYTALAEGGDDEDSDSLDSDEKAERADEEKKARKCFGDLSMTEAGVRVINVSDMEQLITNLGSTYGEDEFGKVVKKLKKPGDKIHETDFIAWYMDWLFGDDDGSDFEDDEDDEGRGGNSSGAADADAPKQDLGSLFQVDKDSWKCEVCSVRNTGEKKQCPACETIRPGFEDDPEVKTGAASGASGSGAIGSGGFSFGGVPSGSIGGGGFSFGGGSTSSAKPHEKATSGFTFGGGASSGGGFSFGGAPAPTSDGKEKPGGGFTFASGTGGEFSFGAPAPAAKKEESDQKAKNKSKDSSTSSYPPMSLTAPTPFGAAAPKESSKVAKPQNDSAYPPMAQKAPTPFGSATKPAEKISSSSYPPMSSRAPTAFGESKATPSSSGAYPPLSSEAPTPFGQPTAANAPIPTSSSSYPPLSSKAPTPFGASAAKTSSAGSYPPIAKQAPTPFGSSAKTQEKTTNSAAFPPMSSKAPTPFGAPKASAPASSSYPPLSSAAPTPFGGSTATAKSQAPASSSSYPPLSTKAPTPFGGSTAKPTIGFGAKPEEKSSGSAPFPPMSTKGPTPFGGSLAKPQIGSTGGTAAFPPMSTQAPTPFGASKAPAPGGSAAKPQIGSSDGSAAFPPMSTKAPNPFGASKSPAPASSSYPPLSNKAPTPFGQPSPPTMSAPSMTSSYPPMTSKAPTPFGSEAQPAFGLSVKAQDKTASGSAVFPLMSSKAPTPFEGGNLASTASSFKKSGNVNDSTIFSSSSSYPPLSSTAPTPFGGNGTKSSSSTGDKTPSSRGARVATATSEKQSISENRFISLERKMEDTNARLADLRDAAAYKCKDMESKIGRLVGKVQQMRLDLLGADSSLIQRKERSMFLLSRKTDASRQVQAAKQLVESRSSTGPGSATLAESQPLDYESERNRRKFAVGARSVKDQIDVLQSRIDLLSSVSDFPENPSLVFQAVMELYTDAKELDGPIQRMENKLAETWKLAPFLSFPSNSTTGRSTYGLSPQKPQVRKRERMRPLPLAPTPQKVPPSRIAENAVDKWDAIEYALRDEADKARTIRLTGLSRANIARNATPPSQPIQRGLGRSLLLSPAKGPTPQQSSLTSTNSVVAVFSPDAKAKPRAAWDQVSSIDQNRTKHLSIPYPSDVKEATVSSKARDKLAAVGTTPEKVHARLELSKGEGPARLSPRPKREASQGSTAVDANKSSEGKITSNAAFPPMPSKAPTPFSQKTKGEGAPSSKSSSGSSYPPLSTVAPKPFSSKTSDTSDKAVDASKSKANAEAASGSEPSKSAATAFGDMKGLGNSLFSLGGNSSSKESSAFPPPKPPSAPDKGSTTDYRQILSTFYQKHNPQKLGEVEKTLEKYKGREVEMFQKLAAKYKVPSPLESTGPTPLPSSGTPALQASPFGSGAPAPSPFSSGSTNTSASPFGSSAPASAPSPFGSSAPTSAQSPFGSSAPAPAQSPFGAANPSGLGAASPFGSTSASSTPFGSSGLSSPSPFGSTAAAPQPSPFGSTSAPPPAMPAPGTSQQSFQGRNPRDLLLQFYQQKNPSKISEVDKVLQKYRGNEEQLFRNLAKKYSMDPSVFGLSAGPASAFGAATGAPSPGGFGASPGGFGQQSLLSSSSPFGQSGGFGQPSALGGGSMPQAGGPTFGSSAGSTFGGGSSFGALASSPSPFGSPSPGGFGSAGPGFGSPSQGGFGGASPFGAPRR